MPFVTTVAGITPIRSVREYFANPIVYFMIVYKPFNLLYKLSGALMTALVLAGYGICIANIIFTSKSKCKDSTLGKVSLANAVIFLVVSSLILLVVHIIIWVPICCGKKAPQDTDKVSPNDESSVGLKNSATQRVDGPGNTVVPT
jgi:hypothetical protein